MYDIGNEQTEAYACLGLERPEAKATAKLFVQDGPGERLVVDDPEEHLWASDEQEGKPWRRKCARNRDLACQWRDDNASDLIPFWIFPRAKGAAIERHVPALPLSRDAVRYSELRRSLVLYRMVFGQPRQEDLLEFLSSDAETGRLSPEEIQIDLTPQPLL